MRHYFLIFMTLAVLRVQANPVSDMLERIDSGASERFTIVLEETTDGKDFFELSQQG